MKKALLLLFLIPLVAGAQDITAKADAYLNDMVTQKKFTGAVLVAKGGKILFEKGYGLANQQEQKPVTVETEFRIAKGLGSAKILIQTVKMAMVKLFLLDYLLELTDVELDSTILARINDIASLPDADQQQVFTIVDALVRDAKAKK